MFGLPLVVLAATAEALGMVPMVPLGALPAFSRWQDQPWPIFMAAVAGVEIKMPHRLEEQAAGRAALGRLERRERSLAVAPQPR